ncbi:hypothetical protein [Methylobacterium durans]|uniref:Uncharacterized protein n=1 Tax=Methylobacterium durans TaxID=2202825 RepID=A0A2U8WBI3_9HYPH|nr:hypothetical protein [Methylobacterium durans]AWN42961.1 hypothetical protein DK389_23765 [Methylobacterium durans]
MIRDPLNARVLAAAAALGGLVVMMLEPAPNWHTVAVGLLALAAFAGLSLAGGRRPAGAIQGPRRITVEVIVEDRPLPGPASSPDASPARQREGISAHPAMLAGVRARRARR